MRWRRCRSLALLGGCSPFRQRLEGERKLLAHSQTDAFDPNRLCSTLGALLHCSIKRGHAMAISCTRSIVRAEDSSSIPFR
jgi:hypothetical protein